MAPKSRKGKGVASSSQGSKRAKRTSEEEHEDVSMAPQPLRHYGLRWVTEGLLTRFLCGHDIDEEEADYIPVYYPRGIDVVKLRNPRLRMNGVTEEKLQLQQLSMDYPLSEHSRSLFRVRSELEEPIDGDEAIEDETLREHSDIESIDAEEDDSEMREASLTPTYNEE
ncbi:hypothetical protein HAX54_024492 [Datura stramonium]|uniref:Uncharacterized protein n=1 Tax=Datura stramonium TaxID=4076 RepID=A0ABS8UZU4_DATST|nr:hypothetical protein [Datura stramonium]